jgi:cell division septation protein DedD
MAKNLYVKGYDKDRSMGGRLPLTKRTVFLGILALLALASSLLWWLWQQRMEAKPLPLTRSKVMQRVVAPPPTPRVAVGNEPKRSGTATEMQLAMEATEPAQPPETGTPAPREKRSEVPAEARAGGVKVEEAQQGGPPKDKRQVKAPGEGKQDVARTGSVVIQVGAFRSLSAAESVLEELKAKGYDAYLDERFLKDLGLLHRVRIRGYSTISEANKEMARLEREQGIKPFALSLEPEAKTPAHQ